jgi:hypothetical protein
VDEPEAQRQTEPAGTPAQEARSTIIRVIEEKAVSDEWLLRLHESYTERFLADNERIWSTASLFIPLSLATFPAYFALDERTLQLAGTFGAVSVALVTFWYLIAEKHKTFQNRSYDVVRAIETIIIGRNEMDEIRAAVLRHAPDAGPSVHTTRLTLVMSIWVGWLAVIGTFVARIAA